MASSEQELALLVSAFDLHSPAVKQVMDDYKRELFIRSVSENTMRAYRGDWKHFLAWGDSVNIDVQAIRASEDMESALLLYLTYYLRHPEPKQRLKPSSMSRRLAGIRWHVIIKGLPWPSAYPGSRVSPLGQAVSVANRELGAPPRRAAPISTSMLTQMVALCPDNAKGIRDRSILLLGYCSAMRRSEIAGLNIEDLRFEDEGIVITLPKSKTDQLAQGQTIYLPRAKRPETCPVVATAAWLKVRSAKSGPLYVRTRIGGVLGTDHLTPQVIDVIVKTYAKQVDPLQTYSAHSLRSGLATAASRAGADLRTIMRQTRHTSVESVMGYVREGNAFKDNVIHYLDL